MRRGPRQARDDARHGTTGIPRAAPRGARRRDLFVNLGLARTRGARKSARKSTLRIQPFLVTLTAVENRLDKPNRPSLWGYLRRSNLRGDTAKPPINTGVSASQGSGMNAGMNSTRQCARSTPAKRRPRWRDSGRLLEPTPTAGGGEPSRGWYSSPCRHKSQPRAGDSESVAQRPCRAGPGSSRPSSVTPHLLPSMRRWTRRRSSARTWSLWPDGWHQNERRCRLRRLQPCTLACGRGVRTTRASVVLRRHGDAIDLTSFSVMLPRTWR